MTRIVVAGSILGLVCLAGVARGGSYAEQTAATGIHNTLAGQGGNSAKSMLDTVNRNLPKVSTPDFEKAYSGGRGGGGGKKSSSSAPGGKGCWASGGGGMGGKSAAGKGSWATASSSSGRGASGKSGWESSKITAGKGEGWASATDKTHPASRRR